MEYNVSDGCMTYPVAAKTPREAACMVADGYDLAGGSPEFLLTVRTEDHWVGEWKALELAEVDSDGCLKLREV